MDRFIFIFFLHNIYGTMWPSQSLDVVNSIMVIKCTHVCSADWGKEETIQSMHLPGLMKGGWAIAMAMRTPRSMNALTDVISELKENKETSFATYTREDGSQTNRIKSRQKLRWHLFYYIKRNAYISETQPNPRFYRCFVCFILTLLSSPILCTTILYLLNAVNC